MIASRAPMPVSRSFEGGIGGARDSRSGTIFVVLVTLLAAFLAAVAAGTAVWFGGQTPDIGKASAEFVARWRGFLAPEPIERAAYLGAVVAVFPAAVLAAIWTKRSRHAASMRLPAMQAWHVLVVVVAVSLFGGSFAHYTLTGNEVWSTATLSIRFISMVVPAVALAGLLIHGWGRWRFLRSAGRGVYVDLFLALGALGLSVIRVRSADMLYGDIHFEAVFYSVTQVARGHTLLVDLPAQYGLYAELLAPLANLAGLSVFGFSILLAVLHLVSLLALVCTLSILVQSALLRLVSGLTIFFFVGSTWLLFWDSAIGHEYFQIWPLRVLFPSLVALSFLIAHRQGMKPIHVGCVALVSGLGLVWNFDWGVPAYGALVSYFLLRVVAASRDTRRQDGWRLALVTVIPVFVCLAFLGYLSIKGDGNLSLGDWLKYQSIFYSSGFGMLPLPLPVHAWVIVFALYLCGLGYGVARQIRGRGDLRSDAVMLLSVMGIGIFTYYQGRSHDIVLSFVVWPAILVAFTFVDRVLCAKALGQVPSFVAWTTLPILAFGLSACFAMIVGIPRLVGIGDAVFHRLNEATETVVDVNARFIRQRVGSADTTVILSGGQSVLFAETGLASAVKGPGVVEMLLQQNLDELVAALLKDAQPDLFIDDDGKGQLPVSYQPLLARYAIVDASKNGLLHLRPRSTSGAGLM
ncbi:hypothetical protein [Mesorhizobium amorphae]|uniref:hypothetical protein n=1 Tax=Mesorhizobium amorphae TaxID=71433 RepID=UPI0011859F15|nr:hypothetical protein [Mesorhizobium amorphae]